MEIKKKLNKIASATSNHKIISGEITEISKVLFIFDSRGGQPVPEQAAV